jgi:hypothetical protein
MILVKAKLRVRPENTNRGGRLSTVDLIEVPYFVKYVDNIFIIKSRWFKLISTRRSTVLNFPLK